MYAQVTLLFNSAPDLLEDFKQFLPESAAQAKAQTAAGRQATEEIIVSNVRGEPGYNNSALPQPQGSRGDVKMPPLGQFNVKDSKEGKKRRGGPGGAASTAAAMNSTEPMNGTVQGNKAGASQLGNVNKVSLPSHLPVFAYLCHWLSSSFYLFDVSCSRPSLWEPILCLHSLVKKP